MWVFHRLCDMAFALAVAFNSQDADFFEHLLTFLQKI
jgi:hypothetical protein